MPRIIKQNILGELPDCRTGEVCEEIASGPDVRLERISSLGQATAAGTWLKQPRAEWVVLLSGRASLLFAGEDTAMALEPGDYVFIPANCRHRVEWTDPKINSVWLALHYRETADPVRSEELLGVPAIENVEIIRTGRRKHTASARLVRNTMYVRVPKNIQEAELERVVGDFKEKLGSRVLKDHLNRHDDLRQRAAKLNKKYFSGALKLKAIEYVTGQKTKFGCCDFNNGVIRIAHHVAAMPVWVREYVLMHELAHLVEPNHGKNFWDIVNRYPMAERAKGFLLAKGYELNETE